MVKRVHVFILFFKAYENNFYLFSKICYLFHFIFKNYLKTKNSFKITQLNRFYIFLLI